jgi:thiol-disulfide isomerase/thioredoxin
MRFLSTFLVSGALAFAGEFTVGSTLASIEVDDHGKAHTVLLASGKPTAVIFTSTQCPVSNAYNERMNAVYKDYSGKGVNFTFVNANATETAENVDRHASSNGWNFRVYKDPQNRLADKLNAQVTPEVFLFDKTGTLVYHGRIDDSQNEAKIKTRDFRAALDALLAGKPVAVSEAKAFGCTIKRVRSSS